MTATVPCLAADAELWFATSPDDIEAAKAMCRDCRLRGVCLQGALERGEPWGVWGGELFLHGAVIARKRPRGRPRKDGDWATQHRSQLSLDVVGDCEEPSPTTVGWVSD